MSVMAEQQQGAPIGAGAMEPVTGFLPGSNNMMYSGNAMSRGLLSSALPDPPTIAKQKECYLRMLEQQLKQSIGALDAQLKHQKEALLQLAEAQKKQFNMQVDMEVKQNEIQLQQQYQEQQLALQTQAQQQRATLEQQSMSLTMEYQQKRAEEEMAKQQFELERQQQEMQMRMHSEIQYIGFPQMQLLPQQPLSSLPSFAYSAGQHQAAAPPTPTEGSHQMMPPPSQHQLLPPPSSTTSMQQPNLFGAGEPLMQLFSTSNSDVLRSSLAGYHHANLDHLGSMFQSQQAVPPPNAQMYVYGPNGELIPKEEES